MNNFITITELIYASWIFYSSLNANKFQILLRNIKIFFSILSFNFLIFRTLYQILFYYYFNRTISRICDFVSIQMPIKCTQKKVTNHVTECSKEEIIKTIEKKKKKNWTSTSACRLCIIVTREYSTFVIFWYIILNVCWILTGIYRDCGSTIDDPARDPAPSSIRDLLCRYV